MKANEVKPLFKDFDFEGNRKYWVYYPISKKRPTTSPTPTPTPTPAFDSDAAAYLADVIASGGTLDSTISGATDTLYKTLKADNIYDKLDVFYLMLGGDAATTSIMGKRVSGTTYDLTYNGGFTYSASGATGNGVNGWANTHFNTDDTRQDNYSLGFYQFTENSPAQISETIIGANYPGIEPRVQIATATASGSDYSIRSGDSTRVAGANGGNIDGFYVLNRTGSTTSELYRNGNTTPILNLTASYTEQGSSPIAVWNFYQLTDVYFQSYANQGLSFIFIGQGFTSTELQDLESAVNTFQTTLSRNTY